jgi:hypothetical protein
LVFLDLLELLGYKAPEVYKDQMELQDLKVLKDLLAATEDKEQVLQGHKDQQDPLVTQDHLDQ